MACFWQITRVDLSNWYRQATVHEQLLPCPLNEFSTQKSSQRGFSCFYYWYLMGVEHEQVFERPYIFLVSEVSWPLFHNCRLLHGTAGNWLS